MFSLAKLHNFSWRKWIVLNLNWRDLMIFFLTILITYHSDKRSFCSYSSLLVIFHSPFWQTWKRRKKRNVTSRHKYWKKSNFLKIFDNYFESLKPKYVGWSNDALANEATEFLKRSAPLGREAIRGWINSHFKLREQAEQLIHFSKHSSRKIRESNTYSLMMSMNL